MYKKSRFDNSIKRLKGRALQVRNKRLLEHEALCRSCKSKSIVTAATEIDHIVPLFKGGLDIDANLQPLCTPCHTEKSIIERGETPRKSQDLQGLDWI